MISKSTKINLGVIYAVITALSIGAITTQARIFYDHGGNAMTLMFYRFLFTVMVTGLIIAVKKRDKAHTHDPQWGLTILTGIIWSGAMVFYLTSVQTIPVSIAVLTLYTFPLIVLMISLWKGSIVFSRGLLGLFVLAFIGLALALLNGGVDINGIGLLFAACAAIGAAATMFLSAKIAKNNHPITLAFKVSVVGLIMLIPLVWGSYAPSTTTIGWVALGGATACYIVAIIFQFAALSRLKPAIAAFILNLEPIVSIVLAAALLGEILLPWQWLGVGLVMTVILLSSRFSSVSQ